MKIRTLCATFAFFGLTSAATSAQAEETKVEFSLPSICRTVKFGDNPWNLVRKIGGIVDRPMIALILPRFMADNEISNPRRLMPGQRVCFWEDMIPQTARSTSASTTTIMSTVTVPALEAISQPLVWPITSRSAIYISQIFDPERDHFGLDLAAPLGTELLASGDGLVTRIFEDEFKLFPCGNEVEVRYASHTLVYCHLNEIKVAEGAQVIRRTILGTVGQTGNATGPHVHLMVVDRTTGRAVDPFAVLDGSRAPSFSPKAAARREVLLARTRPSRPAFAIARSGFPRVTLMIPQ